MAEETLVRPYSLKTLMPGWQWFKQGYPKDNDPYNSSEGGPKDYRGSTYRRLGTYEAPWLTSLQEAQGELSRRLARPGRPSLKRPLINILTFHTTEGPEREKHIPETDIEVIPMDQLRTDYQTSMQRDYRLYRPMKTHQPDLEEIFKPETKFRRLITDEKDIRRPGIGTFYDENLEYLNIKRRPRVPAPYKTDYE